MRYGLAISLALTALTIAGTPAFAMKGYDAAVACEKNPKCHVTYYPNGATDITVEGDPNVILCEGPRAECTILRTPGKAAVPASRIPTLLQVH